MLVVVDAGGGFAAVAEAGAPGTLKVNGEALVESVPSAVLKVDDGAVEAVMALLEDAAGLGNPKVNFGPVVVELVPFTVAAGVD